MFSVTLPLANGSIQTVALIIQRIQDGHKWPPFHIDGKQVDESVTPEQLLVGKLYDCATGLVSGLRGTLYTNEWLCA